MEQPLSSISTTTWLPHSFPFHPAYRRVHPHGPRKHATKRPARLHQPWRGTLQGGADTKHEQRGALISAVSLGDHVSRDVLSRSWALRRPGWSRTGPIAQLPTAAARAAVVLYARGSHQAMLRCASAGTLGAQSACAQRSLQWPLVRTARAKEASWGLGSP